MTNSGSGDSFTLQRLAFAGGELHGLLRASETPAVTLHVHGTWGNFYENSIATAFATVYERSGYQLLSVNLPSHDSGSVTEVFSDSLPALEAWVTQISKSGPIIWQGHSLGALKILALLLDPRYSELRARTKALVLLSPFDLAAFYAQSNKQSVIANKAAAAAEIVSAGHGGDYVPVSEFDIWPVSYGTYAEALKRGGLLDVFPTSSGSIGALATLSVPTLTFVGGGDFAASPSPEAVQLLLTRGGANLRAELIPHAPHNFAGHEAEVEQLLAEFLNSLA